MDFLLSLLTAVGGAFLGTMAAFLSERWLRTSDAKRVEAAALNNLITDLHLRRSLTPITPKKSYLEPNDDRKFTGEAIMQIRTSIRDARLALRPKSSESFQALVRMSSACNAYLENVQNRPEDYQFELHELRLVFSTTIKTLSQNGDVVMREPGAAAFDLSPMAG
ncbi:hypothetical protein AAE021_12325 [Arthrobacter citreus]|jgi:hypothetical protein|uniref:LemA family protein n=1 Tax=Arthrobacter citreus TaxID=1670 RepID=A0ABZ2ZS14_9MICC